MFDDPDQVFDAHNILDPSGRTHPMPALYVVVLPNMLLGQAANTRLRTVRMAPEEDAIPTCLTSLEARAVR